MSKSETIIVIRAGQREGACDTLMNTVSYLIGYHGCITPEMWDAITYLYFKCSFE